MCVYCVFGVGGGGGSMSTKLNYIIMGLCPGVCGGVRVG